MFNYFDPENGFLCSIIIDAFHSEVTYTTDPRFAIEADAEYFSIVSRLLLFTFNPDNLILALYE